MRSHILPLALGLSLALLPLYTAACGDSPLTPDELAAAEPGITDQLNQILDQLAVMSDRLDSLQVAVDNVSGGGLSLSGLPAAQLDSIIDLTSFIATEMVSGGVEACASVDLAGEFGTEWIGEAEGEGAGHLGAWAGTGAYAGGKVTGKAEVGVAIMIEGAGGVEYCHPLFAATPPVRPAPAGAPQQRAGELDQVGAALDNLQSQFNLNPGMLAQSIDGIGTAISSPASLSLDNLDNVLPLPPALSSIATNPIGTVSGHIQTLTSTAQDALCSGGNWGSNLSSVLSEACSVINGGGLSNFSVLSDITNTYPAVQTAVSNVCTRVNSMGLKRLVISSWDVTILGATYRVFPGYNERLFPNYSSVSCP